MEEDAKTTLASEPRPRLIEGLARRRNADGRLVLIGRGSKQYMDLRDHEVGILDLLDGSRDVDAVVRDAVGGDSPLGPLDTMTLLHRLDRSGLLDFGEEQQSPFVQEEKVGLGPGLAKAVGHLACFRVPLTMPRQAWTTLRTFSLLLVASALVFAAAKGRFAALFDPFAGYGWQASSLILFYVCAAGILSFRGIMRGLVLTALKIRVSAFSLQVVVGILHLEVDDRDRRLAARDDRAVLAWTGISALALVAGVASWFWMYAGSPWAHQLASVSLLLLIADLAPYARTDGRHLVGISVRIPELRRRSTSYLLRRTTTNLLSGKEAGRLEKFYLWVVTFWLVHAILALHVLSGYVLPGVLHTVVNLWNAPAYGQGGPHPIAWIIGLLVGLLLVLGLITMILLLFGSLVGGLAQLFRPKRGASPVKAERIGGTGATAFVNEVQRIPFLANIEPDELSRVVASMRREVHRANAVMIRQGEPGDRFCYLQRGRARVLLEEESGLVHVVATLEPGDFFGEVALLKDVPRTATVQAIEEVELLTLDRATFVDFLERAGIPREDVLDQVRNSAFLHTVPLFSCLPASRARTLLESAQVEQREAGDEIVRQGEPGTALYIIREGTCRVTHKAADGGESEVAKLDAGDYFGEISLLRGTVRTATVVAETDAVLLMIPASVFAEILLEDVQATMEIQRAAAERLSALEAA